MVILGVNFSVFRPRNCSFMFESAKSDRAFRFMERFDNHRIVLEWMRPLEPVRTVLDLPGQVGPSSFGQLSKWNQNI